MCAVRAAPSNADDTRSTSAVSALVAAWSPVLTTI